MTIAFLQLFYFEKGANQSINSVYSISRYVHFHAGNESPNVSITGQEMDGEPLPNEISAPYEVPQFPIEQIEKKLQIQRHLNVR